MAWAVNAMMTWRKLLFSLSSGCRSRFKSIHLWHLHVHQHNVESLLLRRGQRLMPVAGHRDTVPSLSNKRTIKR
jgi:hypothetical protein